MTDSTVSSEQRTMSNSESSFLARLQKLASLLRKNPGFSLMGLNVSLLLAAFLVFDPFGWIRTSYLDAEPLLRVAPARIDVIEVRDLSVEGQAGFSIQRSDAVAVKEERPENGVEPSEEQKLIDSVQGFQWNLKTEAGEVGYADVQRLARLLYSLQRSRKYYELDNDTSALKEYNLEHGLEINVILDDGSRSEILVGRSSIRGNESYVLVDDSIYLVQENLRRDLGAGNAEYFRNRQMIPIQGRDSVTRLNVRFKNPTLAGYRNVELARAGGDWRMLQPEVGSVRPTEMNLLLDDLLDIRAREFLDEVPPRLDNKQAMELSLVYRSSMGSPGTFTLEVLGKKSYDSYLFRTEDGQLFEGNSLYIEKLLAPEQSLLDRGEEPMDFRMP